METYVTVQIRRPVSFVQSSEEWSFITAVLWVLLLSFLPVLEVLFLFNRLWVFRCLGSLLVVSSEFTNEAKMRA